MRELIDVLMIGILVVVSWGDWKRKEISVRMLLIMTVLTGFKVLFFSEKFIEVVLGIGIGVGFLLISKWTKEQIGYGDSWLILILGIYIGFGNLLVVLFVASLGAALFSLVFCMLHQWNRNYTIPFVPFLAAAYVGVML